MKVQRPHEATGRCANCEFVDQTLHRVRLRRPTGRVVESLVCSLCFVKLTGVTPSTARKLTRPER